MGDGKNIRVFKDCWLPRNLGDCILSIALELDGETCVADLIDVDTVLWNARIIDENILLLKLNVSNLFHFA